MKIVKLAVLWTALATLHLSPVFANNTDGYEDPRPSNPSMTCYESQEDTQHYKITVQTDDRGNSFASVFSSGLKLEDQLPCKPIFYDPVGDSTHGHALVFECARPYDGPALPPNEYGVGIFWYKDASYSSAHIDHGERGTSITLTNLDYCIAGER